MKPPFRLGFCIARKADWDGYAIYLWRALGPAAFRRFQQRWGGKRIRIPKLGCRMPCQYCGARDRHLRLLSKRGWSASRLARAAGLTRKRVYKILKG